MLRSFVGDDAAPDPLGDLRDEGVAEGSQAVNPVGDVVGDAGDAWPLPACPEVISVQSRGKPIRNSTNVGFSEPGVPEAAT
jgi:hypothetical protein